MNFMRFDTNLLRSTLFHLFGTANGGGVVLEIIKHGVRGPFIIYRGVSTEEKLIG